MVWCGVELMHGARVSGVGSGIEGEGAAQLY